jgi:hypothetical protein
MDKEEASILADIFRIIADDPDPGHSVTLHGLTARLVEKKHKVAVVDVLGYVIQQRDAGTLRLEAVDEGGDPHIRFCSPVTSAGGKRSA